ncbi:MAG: hypothetical protein KDB01_21815 [Planctomycetaceae bacterium]|nr:hypothetical protein [Planctomycetaceae bacterium]
MLTDESRRTAIASRQLYDVRLREQLEQSDNGKFVCIEPQSGDYFVGDTLDDAVNAAIDAYPDRLTHTLRIGHSAALHIGVMFQ